MRGLAGIGAAVAVLAALWLLVPRAPPGGPPVFDPATLGADLDAYLHRAERDVPDLVRGTQKHILWADPAARDRRPVAVVYVHGFSATLEEIRPVPDRVARALDANLFYTRLAGHGRDGAALARAYLEDWTREVAEAIAIGRRLGERVILIGTSTGATLIARLLAEPRWRAGVDGVVLVSPNFALADRRAALLHWPFAETLVPRLAGAERRFVPHNARHAKYWTEAYPTVALLPMAAAVRAARAADLGAIDVPALFAYSDADRVVDPAATRAAAARWGGPVTLWPVAPGPADDPAAHVIAGDILSPGLTDAMVARILEWVRARDPARRTPAPR